jgi:serine/threonine-protein kinase
MSDPLPSTAAHGSATETDDPQLLRARALVGTTLRGKYRLDRVLGTGGMAAVYGATHRNQAEFAVKMLHPELADYPELRTRFLREGYAANSVKHPGVVLVVDDDVAENGAAFLVMELLRGCCVEDLGSRLPVDVALAIADQLLDVLAAAHAKGIVHRDIKPANLFLLPDGTVKVLDFGIARARDAMAGAGAQTSTGMLLGTPAFMAPEQALGATAIIDGQSDVWAVGATIFSMIAGEYVHAGTSSQQLLVHAATRQARSIGSVVSGLPTPVVALIDAALAFEKGNRWKDAATMQAALREAFETAYGAPPGQELLAATMKTTDAGAPSGPQKNTPNRGTPPDGTPLGTWIPGESRAATHEGPAPYVASDSASREAPRLRAATTPFGVEAREPQNPTRRAPIALAGGIAALLVLGLGGAFALSHRADARPSVAAEGTAKEPAKEPVASPSVSAAAPEARVEAPSPAPSATPGITPPTPAVTPAKAQAAKAKPVAPVAPAAPAAATAHCSPPYFFDSQNRKVFKPECL